MQSRIKIVFIVVAALGLIWTLRGSNASTQTRVETAGQKFKSIRVLNDMPADQMGKVMNMMSASLGVKCGFCHESDDGGYEKEGFEHKDVARKMIRMTLDLNRTHFNGEPEVSCNTCHNGRPHPQSGYPLAPLPRPERPVQPPTRPSADQIIDKYLRALGGPAAFAKIKSRIISSTRIEPDGKTTEPETIWLSDRAFRSDLAYGKYIVTEIFDGTQAKKYGDGSLIELKPDEAEQVRREGEFFFPWNIRSIYPRLEYRSLDRIDGREVHALAGTTAGGVSETLSFDAVSGFLVRRTSATPTMLGDFVYQVEYADYRNFKGLMMPATMRYAVPNIRWTRKLNDVKMNVPVDNAKFTSPRR